MQPFTFPFQSNATSQISRGGKQQQSSSSSTTLLPPPPPPPSTSSKSSSSMLLPSSSLHDKHRLKRKSVNPVRSIKRIDSKYEKKAQGIIELNFIHEELKADLTPLEAGTNRFVYASDDGGSSEVDDDSGSGSRIIGSRKPIGLERRALRGSSRLAAGGSNSGGDAAATSGSNSVSSSSSSPEAAETFDDDNNNNMDSANVHVSRAVNNSEETADTGTPSKKYFFDPSKSVAYLTSHEHVKAIGLLSRKGKIGAPLNITRMENVDDLNEEEFHICSVLRIFPAQYIKAKEVMLAEFKTRGYFKKSAAQKMLRMDVNKTGKLYDYFSEMGWLSQ